MHRLDIPTARSPRRPVATPAAAVRLAAAPAPTAADAQYAQRHNRDPIKRNLRKLRAKDSMGSRLHRRASETVRSLSGTRASNAKPARAVVPAPAGRAQHLDDLPDDAFVFGDGYDSDSSAASAASASSAASDASMLSVRSVLSNGERVLPARILGKELDVLALPDSDDETEDATMPALVRTRAGRNMMQDAKEAVDGIVHDIKRWHALPFDTVWEKCEFVATTNNRLPMVLVFFTLLLSVVVIVGIAASAFRSGGGRGGSGGGRGNLLGGGVTASGAERIRDSGSDLSSALFRLVPAEQ